MHSRVAVSDPRNGISRINLHLEVTWDGRELCSSFFGKGYQYQEDANVKLKCDCDESENEDS
jgi:hypothetical protein